MKHGLNLPVVVAWPLGTTPPPHIRNPTALMWGLSPNDDEMDCDVSGSPPKHYIDSDQVPWSSPENLGNEPINSESDLTKDPCSD